MVSQSTEPRTLSEVVYRRLRADIVWGKLGPGTPLRSDQLRVSYDVGISPLREALTRLVSERLVTSIGQRGFRVAPIDRKDVIDLTETRIVVETAALEQAIRNGGVAWESALVAAHHGLSRAPVPNSQGADAEVWASAHRAFHLALLRGSDSDWKMHLAELFFDQTERLRSLGVRLPVDPEMRDPAKEHQEILTATLDRDVNRATKALAYHYRSTMLQSLAAIAGQTGETSDE